MEEQNRAQIKALKDQQKKLNEERAQVNSKKQLMYHVKKKMQTTFIGALNSFEDGFGYVWGHGLLEEELTDDQLRAREIWEEVRTAVLNRGNNQLRAAMDEIAQYTLNWNRYSMDLVVKPMESTEND